MNVIEENHRVYSPSVARTQVGVSEHSSLVEGFIDGYTVADAIRYMTLCEL